MSDQVLPERPDPGRSGRPPRRAPVPSQQTTGGLSDAADAHLLVRTALLHPAITGRVLHELFTAAQHATVASVPLTSLATVVAMEFGPKAWRHAADQADDPELSQSLHEVHAALCLLRSDIDAYVELDRAMVRILDTGATDRQGVTALLAALTAGASYVGEDEAERLAHLLLEQCLDTAMARADDLEHDDIEDDEADQRLRTMILARLAALAPGPAARCAADIAALGADDPLTEAAQHELATLWWRHTVELLSAEDITEILESAAGTDHPDQVRTVLLTLSDPRTRREPATHLSALPGPVVLTSVAHAIALVVERLQDPNVALAAITHDP